MTSITETKMIKIGVSHYIRIPASLFNDSTFPFDCSDTLNIEICADSLQVRKHDI